MKAAILLTLLPAASLAFPISYPKISDIFSRQTAALDSATDELLFQTTLESFIVARSAQNPAGLDWASNGCTASPDNPFGFKFEPACNRHDFGYRNYRKQDRFSEANKLKIDNNFKSDLYHQCEKEKHDTICRITAKVYYEAVRAFGKRELEDALENEINLE